jgi:cell division protein FtsZ
MAEEKLLNSDIDHTGKDRRNSAEVSPMALNFLPGSPSELKPRITVIGVGGAGGNAVNNMIASRLEGVEFIVANTDAQALAQARTENRIQLGTAVTQGLGAGSRPDVGRAAAEESMEDLTAMLDGCNMVFITAGMGGGTGTGAGPVIARAARDMGILTVGVVTKPFHFEGAHRMRTAESGIEELTQYVDTLIIIPNQNLFRIATERTTFADAFKMADDVLHSGVRGVTDLMMMPGLINLDFADIRTVMSEMGKAMMGTGEAEGDKRAIEAAESAISNPLLDDSSMKGARGVLINITGGLDMTLFEVDEAANRIRDEVDPDANIIFGSTFDEKLNGRVRVSVVATGIQSLATARPAAPAQAVDEPAPPPPVATQPAQAAARPGQTAFRPVNPAAAAPRPPMNRPFPRDPAPATSERREPAPVVAPPQAEAPMPRPEIPLSQRREPTLGRPGSAPPRVPSYEEPDMNSLSRAVTEIAENAPSPPRADEPRRSGSLFDRLVTHRRQAAQSYHEDAPQSQPQPQPQAQPQPRQGNVEPRREPVADPVQPQDLDIPAFLRRQAN